MKLFYSTNSPYARKCRVVMFEKGLEDRVELINVNPMENPPELLAVNPLGTIPAMITEDGLHLCDSTVICEYLDRISPHQSLLPEEAHVCVLAMAVLADGIMDAAVSCVIESRRPPEKKYPEWVSRKEAAIMRAIDKFSPLFLPQLAGGDQEGGGTIKASPTQPSPASGGGLEVSFGTINLAVALAYVSFRLPHLDWRGKHPKLAAWLDEFSKRPSMQKTMPVA